MTCARLYERVCLDGLVFCRLRFDESLAAFPPSGPVIFHLYKLINSIGISIPKSFAFSLSMENGTAPAGPDQRGMERLISENGSA